MIRDFKKHIEKSLPLTRDDHLLIGNSGGLDSMVLSHLLMDLDYTFSVAHMNFQLRGDEALSDQKFVEDFCKAAGINCYTQSVDTLQVAKSREISIQMAARDLRYDWFMKICQDADMDWILTAHHADDNLETALYNLTKGTGIDGLGIPEITGNIIRPLLPFSREQIKQFAGERRITWREDRSNQDMKYHRNFLRQEVVPGLRAINPSVSEGFHHSYRRFQGVATLLTERIREIEAEHLKKKDNRWELDLSWLRSSDADLVVLERLVNRFGFGFRQTEQIYASLHGQSGREFQNVQYVLVVDRSKLLISKNTKKITIDLTIPGNGNYDTPFGLLSVRTGSGQEMNSDPCFAFLDTSKVSFPLRLRNWENGDRFHPLGMDNSKKLSDFLIDRKTSKPDKGEVLVMEAGDGQICWVVGMRIDNRYKIGPGTQQILVFEWTPL